MANSKKQNIEAPIPAHESAVPKPGFLGSVDGVTVVETETGYAVAFAYDRDLVKFMRSVPGTQFDRNEELYEVPAASMDALEKAVTAMRTGFHFLGASLENIKLLASTTGYQAQRENGAQSTVAARVSDYIEPGKFYGGEILHVNGHYAAQLTGFGKDDGAAFVAIHRLAQLDNQKLMKGENVGIKYDSKFSGAVSDLSRHKSAAELDADFLSQQGKVIDGVMLTDRGSHIGLEFELNPAMLSRLKRVDGAKFNYDDKVWEIPSDKSSFALRAAHDMRAEYVADAKEVVTMKAAAESKIDGAKVFKAFTKDGQEHFGVIIAVGDRYALQKGGQDRFSLHHLAALTEKPVVGQSLAIKYNKGVGTAVDQIEKKALDKAMGSSR